MLFKNAPMRFSNLGCALTKLTNAEKTGNRRVLVRTVSKTVISFLLKLQRGGYVGDFERVSGGEDSSFSPSKIVVWLTGRLTKAMAISPQYFVKTHSLRGWSGKLLPASGVGELILSVHSYCLGGDVAEGNTNADSVLLTGSDALFLDVGGKLLGFFY
jgi:ribosomal protein S8